MLGIDIIDDDGKMAVSIALRIRFLAIEVDGEFDLERRGRVPQIDQREIREFQMVGDFEPERARVKVE